FNESSCLISIEIPNALCLDERHFHFREVAFRAGYSEAYRDVVPSTSVRLDRLFGEWQFFEPVYNNALSALFARMRFTNQGLWDKWRWRSGRPVPDVAQDYSTSTKTHSSLRNHRLVPSQYVFFWRTVPEDECADDINRDRESKAQTLEPQSI